MTLDRILKNLRLSKNLTVKELSDILIISVDDIKILESQNCLNLLSKKNINVFLKKYSKFFDLDFKKIKKYFIKNNLNSLLDQRVFIRKINQNFSFFGFVKMFTVFSVFLLLFFYMGTEIKNRYSKPDLFVFSPLDNYNTKNNEVAIKGKTIKNANVKINGEFVLLDQFGNFAKDILLNDGLNVIRISAAKDRGEENVVVKRIILEKNKVTINE